jgi:DNA topoisomerase-1
MVLGDCSCGGEIRIRRARKSGKRFAGCARWPECEVVFPLPQRGLIAATNELCEACGTPKIRVINKGRRPWELCLDPNCPTKAKPEDKSEAGGEGGTAPAGAGEGEADAG